MAYRRLAAQDRKSQLITTVKQATRDKVERIADRDRVSISEVTRRALEQYVDAKQGSK